MSGRFKPPDVEESVACNLIPMIDIMFLLLLFFMLGADMTQRELEEVELPKADQVKQEDEASEAGSRRTNVNIYHTHTSSGFTCDTHTSGGICRNLDHWAIAIRSSVFTLDTIGAKLKEEAELLLEDPDPSNPGPRLSKVEVMIRADRNAPYGYIQRVIESCGGAGLYKIAVSAARPDAS